jgi:DEAD/DEAH box helicase domain-containing protein
MAHLLVECARHDLRVIAFCKTKKLCELVLRYARELLANSNGTRFLETLRAYRGGYTAGDRRATESALFDGSLRAVAATNALELGVDVGVLDATLHLGFPGSTSSLTQQAGRAGRRGKRALGIYVAFDGPLDQYFMRRPEKLFEAAEKERAAIDCANPAILAAHVACAAYELPLDPRPEGVDARTYFFTGAETRGERRENENEPSDFRVAAEALVRDAKLARDPSVAASRAGDLRLRWVGDSASGPARGVSVRTIESERYAVVDMDTGKTVEEIEASKAFWSVHPGAVYLNQARTFLVKALDVEARVARVRRADVKYFTRSVDTTRLTLVDNSGSKAAYPDRPAYPAAGPVRGEKRRASSAQTAACEVVIQFTGFKKVHQGTGAFFDEVSFTRDLRVELPPVTFRTVASWVRVPESARKLARDAGVDFNEAAHAASHALANALPLLLLASHADVAAECFAAAPGVYAPRRLLLYDKHPGGVGIARRAAPVFLELMRLALERVEACDCGAECEAAPREELGVADAETADLCLPVPAPSGCPGCTHYASCDHYNDGLDKRGAVVVLRETIRVEEMRLRELAAGEDPSRGEGFVNVSS